MRRAAAAGGAALLGGPLQGFTTAAAALTQPLSVRRSRLVPVPDLRDGVVRLHLPEGFAYRSFHDTESPVILDDGTRLPGRHDGMAAFPGPNGSIVLVRNHEINGVGAAFGDPSRAYDAKALGGTTTVQLTRFGEVVRAFTSLSGTLMNCGGGPTPWGSWITCEMTVNGPDVGPDFSGSPNHLLQQRHGFVFEVPADGQSDAQPITAAGRFAHEAVAWDPRGRALYLTEDNFGFPSGFYRFLPARDPATSGRLGVEGRLQMLAVEGQPNADLATSQRRRATYKVRWVDIEDPAPTFPYTPGQFAPTSNSDALTYVSRQGWAQGAAYFSRLEGATYDNGVVYFCSTQGGGPAEVSVGPVHDGYGNGAGQVWAYNTQSEHLQLVFESPDKTVLDMPDNITISGRGTLVLCEDGTNDNYLRGLSRGGQVFDIALNRLMSGNGRPRFDDEFAGATFSPDGTTLFVNIQASSGISFAIWGPWERIGV